MVTKHTNIFLSGKGTAKHSPKTYSENFTFKKEQLNKFSMKYTFKNGNFNIQSSLSVKHR